jgi:enoyl-CoA hydratase/carnithine racemase
MTTGARALPVEASHVADEATFWSAEAAGGVTTLRFHDGGLGSGTDLQRTRTLWEFFEGLLASPPTILRISFPPDGLSHGALVRLWQYFRDLAHTDAANRWPTCSAQAELRRENIALARYMTYVRDPRLFVIGDVRGQIDVNLLGLLLVCDYRIASPDAVILPGANPLGQSFATAVPALLSSIAGPSRALGILLQEEPLNARRALRQGLFHRLTSVHSHEQDAAAIAVRLSAKGPACLRALKSATAAAAPELDSQLEATGGAGFNRVPVPPKCEVCEYDLTGNVSGRCPECGHDIPRANELLP